MPLSVSCSIWTINMYGGIYRRRKSRIEDLKRQQPNAPAFVCELQGGWFSTVGGGLSEDSYLDGRHARGMALMAMAGGSTGLNYYMFFRRNKSSRLGRSPHDYQLRLRSCIKRKWWCE